MTQFLKHSWDKTRGWKLPILGLIGFGFTLVYVLGQKAPPANVPVITPPKSPHANAIAGIGVIEPKSELIAIGTELSGVVRHVFVEVGQVVHPHDPLFSMDQREVEAQIETLKVSLAVAKVQAEDAADQFALVQGIKDNRAVSKEDYNRRSYAVQSSRARVKELLARLKQVLTTQKRLTVNAPIHGTVLEVNVRPGEFAQAGILTQPLIRMGDMSTLHVRVEIDEEASGYFSKGSAATAYPRGNPNQSYPLTFVRVEPYVQPKRNLVAAGQRVDTRVMEVIYALPQDAQDLWVGQRMDVYIQQSRQGAPK